MKGLSFSFDIERVVELIFLVFGLLAILAYLLSKKFKW